MPKGICYNASRQERRKCSLWHAKSPGGRNSGAFLFRCGKVAYSLGWLPPIYLRPAICRCSRRLHLPRQRVRKTKIYSWWHTPFAVFLISLAVSVYFAEPIRAVIPINLLLLLILVHIVYVLIRWYVKGCMRSRGYY